MSAEKKTIEFTIKRAFDQLMTLDKDSTHRRKQSIDLITSEINRLRQENATLKTDHALLVEALKPFSFFACNDWQIHDCPNCIAKRLIYKAQVKDTVFQCYYCRLPHRESHENVSHGYHETCIMVDQPDFYREELEKLEPGQPVTGKTETPDPLPAHPGCCDICDTGGCCKAEENE